MRHEGSEVTDIVERLRWTLTHTDTLAIANTERNLAADEIVRLRALITEAVEASYAMTCTWTVGTLNSSPNTAGRK